VIGFYQINVFFEQLTKLNANLKSMF